MATKAESLRAEQMKKGLAPKRARKLAQRKDPSDATARRAQIAELRARGSES